MMKFSKKVFLLILIISALCSDYCEATSQSIINDNSESKSLNFPVVDKCKLNEICVRFCCHYNETCMNETHYNLSHLKEAKFLSSEYKVLKGKPNCGDMYVEKDYSWEFSKNGSVLQHINNNSFSNNHNEYCYENNGSHLLLVCHGEFIEETAVEQVKSWYPILMLLSVPFLLATIFVYVLFKDLRNLHGKCLVSYLSGLILLYLSFALIQLNHDSLLNIKWLCKTTGYIAYISILVCFFWLNVMCYDIYSTFRGFQNGFYDRLASGSNLSEKRRFHLYCLYAFGVPVLITIMVYTFDQTDLILEEFKIGMGEGRCWIRALNPRNIELIYVFLPISMVLVFNATFYTITACKIYRVQKDTSIAREGERARRSKVSKEKARYFLYLRLFIVMGVTWPIEIISWGLRDSLVLHIIDILNCLQGIVIFLLFVWKPRVRTMIVQRVSTSRKSSSSFNRNHLSKTESFGVSAISAETTGIELTTAKKSQLISFT